MVEITGKFETVPNFFDEFTVTCDEERIYAQEVFTRMEWARDLVLRGFEISKLLFVEELFEKCKYDSQVDAIGIHLWYLASMYPVGTSSYGEWVGEDPHLVKIVEEGRKDHEKYYGGQGFYF